MGETIGKQHIDTRGELLRGHHGTTVGTGRKAALQMAVGTIEEHGSMGLQAHGIDGFGGEAHGRANVGGGNACGIYILVGEALHLAAGIAELQLLAHDMQCGGGEGGAGQLVEQHGSGGAALEVHHQSIILGSVGGGSSQQRRQEECPEKGCFLHCSISINVCIFHH